jgi:mRNA interferase MazF
MTKDEVIRRGDIYWVTLEDPKGSGPGYRRPLAVLQSDAFNLSKIQTIICAVLTSNLKLAEAPGNLLLKAKATGLPKDSVLNISQLVTIDKKDLDQKAGTLTRKHLSKLTRASR